jgi:tetratricopeptide (TPR) repeat protein
MRARLAIALVTAALLTTACAESPEAKKARHAGRGQKYFADGKYREALIEYQNVLRIDPSDTSAVRAVGLAHHRLGDARNAFPFLHAAWQERRDDRDLTVSLATIYLAAGMLNDARELASGVLQRDAQDLEALQVIGAAARSAAEVQAAMRRFDAARPGLGQRPDFLISEAEILLKAGDAAGAERALRAAVERDPKSGLARLALASFFAGRGDLQAAEREVKAATEIDPIANSARMRLVDFYVVSGRPAAAREVLDRVREGSEDWLPARRRLAEIARLEGKPDEALAILDGIFKKAAGDVDGHMIKGRVLLDKRQAASAIQEFQTVLRLDPRQIEARYLLARTYRQTGNVGQARAELGVVMEMAPALVEGRLLLAELQTESGNAALAIDSMEKLIADHPGIGDAYVILNTAYLSRRNWAKALEAARKMEAAVPRDPRGPYLAGVTLQAQGKASEAGREFDRAVASLERDLRARPDDVGALMMVAQIHLRRGDLARAKAAYERILAVQPRFVPAANNLAWILMQEGAASDRALHLAQVAKEGAPDDPHIADTLGWILYQRGVYEQAWKLLRDSAARLPDNPDVQYHAGVAARQVGDTEAARRLLARAVAFNGEFSSRRDAQRLLGELQ